MWVHLYFSSTKNYVHAALFFYNASPPPSDAVPLYFLVFLRTASLFASLTTTCASVIRSRTQLKRNATMYREAGARRREYFNPEYPHSVLTQVERGLRPKSKV